ncbi:MAG: hypothetical protein ACFFKA_16960 [Candidatus Thorarchaeota archaeon]
MEELKKLKKKIAKLKNIEQINDIIIDVSKNINQDTLHLIDFLLTKLDSNQLSKIKLNLIFLIGETGKTISLEPKYIDYLISTYYESDRWIRNEIIEAIYKIVKFSSINQSILRLIETGLKEDYEPIQENCLRVLSLNAQIPEEILRAIIFILNPKKPGLNRLILDILKMNLKNEDNLFKFLNHNQNYRILDKEKIRFLLVEYFQTINQLEIFKDNINNSSWDKKIETLFYQEIATLERIYLKG